MEIREESYPSYWIRVGFLLHFAPPFRGAKVGWLAHFLFVGQRVIDEFERFT